jgi:hypothetical protein
MQKFDVRGPAPLLQSACAVVSGLLLVGVLAYAIVVGPGTEIAADQGGDIELALRLRPHH